MGKAFIKLGLWIQSVWCKFQCTWNSWMLAVSFKDIEKCPNKMCECNMQKTYVKS